MGPAAQEDEPLNLLGGPAPSAGITVAGDEITRVDGVAHHLARPPALPSDVQPDPGPERFRNVELPLLLTSLSKAERRRHVETALSIVGLRERMGHNPRQLSGGQLQRVAIARAIVADPTFLLCDEPTGDLDRKSADEILNLVDLLVRDHGKTVLMVTHDPRAAERAQVTLHLDKGVLVEGKAQEEQEAQEARRA
jgi:putative ABC transport system ATP-binding protein